MRPFKFTSILVLFAVSAPLGGCGDSSVPAASGSNSSARGVIVSASDCASFGEAAVKSCADAIERAVASHEASSKTYSNIETCEKDVGQDKCERAASGKYRQKLSAFAVTIGSSTRAEPLYPTKDGAVGFQTASKSVMLASDQSLNFSRLALSVAETQSAQGKKRGKSGGGLKL
ncbi:DUF1190 domain-containing protein [Hyphomicrobium sp.]|uniref:DUF1190 domain-containing protein n=1 Tax=Hyphomicrobium sp. TaxID=82 RepID=UPI002E342148|nr:DUF1190 domain-containing protein [Hyphomicrobium sp.]HEX2841216.1 DUF1190 domain-containing protein [Hyphomicrobium sp.]